MIPAGFSCSDCGFPGNGNGAEVGKMCQDGNWGLKSRHSASPASSFCSGESNFWQAGGASISSTMGLAAPLLYPEQHLMAEAATGWRCSVPGQGSSLFHHWWFAPARDVQREGQGDALGGMSKPCCSSGHSPAPSLRWTRQWCCCRTGAVPQGVPAAAKCGKPQQFWGLSSSSSFSQI